MISTILFEAVLIFVLVFAAILALAWLYALFERFASGPGYEEPFFDSGEPNRRNQSAAPSA